MLSFPEVPPEAWALLPLALAAGLDLYLTLFFLGAATHLGWDNPPPGALTGLQSAPVMVLAVVFYLLEGLAERAALPALFWNTVHVIVRPVTVGLMVLLLLHTAPLPVRIAGVALAAALALATHAVRVGASLVLWLSHARRTTRVLASAAEDAMVLALCALVLDRPQGGSLLALILMAGALPRVRPYLDGFLFGLRAAWGRTWGAMRARRWLDRSDFPRWVEDALDASAPGGPLRGSPAAGFGLPGVGLFRRGWVVVTGTTPVFLHRSWNGPRVLDLGGLRAMDVVEDAFHRRLELARPDGRRGQLHFPPDGPSREGLAAEFQV